MGLCNIVYFRQYLSHIICVGKQKESCKLVEGIVEASMAGTKRSVRPRPSKSAASSRSSENVAPVGNKDRDTSGSNKRAKVAKGFHMPKRAVPAETHASADDRAGAALPEFHKSTTLKSIEKNTGAPTSFGGSSLHNVASLEAKLNHLQRKYMDLKSIRYTEPERLLNNLQEKYSERDRLQTDQIETWAARTSELKARLQRLEGHGEFVAETNNVEQLKSKVGKLRGRLAKVEQERDAVLNSLNAQHVGSNSKNVDLGSFGRHGSASGDKKVNLFYKLLTSLSLEVKPNSGNMFVCKGISKATNQEVAFEIGLVDAESGGNEMVYSPISNAQCLPPHFREDISFEQTVAPLFFSQIASALLQSEIL